MKSFLLFFIVVAIWVGNDASKRGMNILLWAILAFLLPIIFVPLYLIMRKPKLTENESEIIAQEVEKLIEKTGGEADAIPVESECPACGQKLEPSQTKCGGCGLQFD